LPREPAKNDDFPRKRRAYSSNNTRPSGEYVSVGHKYAGAFNPMARRNAQTQAKRQREQAKQEKRRAKDARRALRKTQKSEELVAAEQDVPGAA
jgi:hypothetical protein